MLGFGSLYFMYDLHLEKYTILPFEAQYILAPPFLIEKYHWSRLVWFNLDVLHG